MRLFCRVGIQIAGTYWTSLPTLLTSLPQALGDYRIVREVGRGGMGVVYEAEQVSLGGKVALKVPPFAAMLDQRQLQRFQNEARAAASLRHPNIVQVHFVGCERAVHFYAMDYIEDRAAVRSDRIHAVEHSGDDAGAVDDPMNRVTTNGETARQPQRGDSKRLEKMSIPHVSFIEFDVRAFQQVDSSC